MAAWATAPLRMAAMFSEMVSSVSLV